jgi:hypothetical protein
MLNRGLTVAALGLFAATMGCAAGGIDEDSTAEPAADEPLDLTIDRVDVAHGALRLSASMIDGSADVSLSAGPPCGGGELGRGMATRSGFVWALAEDELALALTCDLVVHARVTTAAGLLVKSISLPVAAGVASSSTDETAELQVGSSEFHPSHLDLARSVLARRPIMVGGTPFTTSLSIGGVELEVEPSDTEPTEPMEGELGQPSEPDETN